LANKTIDEYFMSLALLEAKKAMSKNEVPVASILVKDNIIISKAHNLKNKNTDVFSHAEILTIKKAAKKIGDWRLENTTLYVTLEPCILCCGAIIHSRIKRVVFAAKEPKMGAVVSIARLFDIKNIHHKPIYEYGILEYESESLLKFFFKKLREDKK